MSLLTIVESVQKRRNRSLTVAILTFYCVSAKRCTSSTVKWTRWKRKTFSKINQIKFNHKFIAMTQKPTTIFINPKFKNAHFNPHFLPNKKIHVNPKFLHQSVIPEVALQPVSVLPTPTNEFRSNAIIRNTRRTLIRTPAFPRSNVSVEVTKTAPSQQLIRLSKNKLVTAAHLMKCQQKENEIITKTKESIIKSKKLQRKTETKDSVYKIDRRYSPIKKKKKIVSTYSIRRVDANKATATNSSSKKWVIIKLISSRKI